MQSATDGEGDHETGGFRPDAFRVPAQRRDDPVCSGIEREAEGLVPPAAPPAGETLVEDEGVAAVGVGVEPGLGAGADAGGADEAEEDEGGEGEGELEGGVDCEEDEG